MYIPNKTEFWRGVSEYEKYEKRDAIYQIALYLIEQFWGDPSGMANGLGVLLLIWNQAFYRYGSFDFDRLESCISRNMEMIKGFRSKKITDLMAHDENDIFFLFNQFNEALGIYRDNKKAKLSPVSVAKSLHLLAPHFFPLWDQGIALAYGYDYSKEPEKKYFLFCQEMNELAKIIITYDVSSSNRSILRLIDQYNYSKYTKKWL